jgi:hypothetical protein
MLHKTRRHRITAGLTFPQIAVQIVEHSQTLCQGYRCGSLLILNDSITSDVDRYWEYAIVRERTRQQIESVTVNMGPRRAREWAAFLAKMDADPAAGVELGMVALRPHPIGVCKLCA